METDDLPSQGRNSNEKSAAIRNDEENQSLTENRSTQHQSVYAGLGWLDRLLVLWILLAIVIGILLGNFVDDVGPALQKGKFVGVSVPIGESLHIIVTNNSMLIFASRWIARYDVSDLV